MEKFILSSLKIFFWIFIGSIVKITINKIKFLNKINYIINSISYLIISAIIPYFIAITIWSNGIKIEICWPILIFLFIIMLVSYFFSSALKKYNFSIQETFLSLTFMNTLYLGIPVTEYFISPSAIYYTILYSIISTLLQFSIGIFLIFPQIKSLKFIITSPIIYSFILGYLGNLYQIYLPEIFINIKDIIASILSPTMLIFIGYNTELKNITKNISIHIIANILRILIIFILSIMFVIIIRSFLVLDEKFIKTIILVSILPSAVMNYIILKNFNVDTDFTSGEILWGTLITLFLLPYFSEFMEIILLTLK